MDWEREEERVLLKMVTGNTSTFGSHSGDSKLRYSPFVI